MIYAHNVHVSFAENEESRCRILCCILHPRLFLFSVSYEAIGIDTYKQMDGCEHDKKNCCIFLF